MISDHFSKIFKDLPKVVQSQTNVPKVTKDAEKETTMFWSCSTTSKHFLLKRDYVTIVVMWNNVSAIFTVKISCLCTKAHLVLHWCLCNKSQGIIVPQISSLSKYASKQGLNKKRTSRSPRQPFVKIHNMQWIKLVPFTLLTITHQSGRTIHWSGIY